MKIFNFLFKRNVINIIYVSVLCILLGMAFVFRYNFVHHILFCLVCVLTWKYLTVLNKNKVSIVLNTIASIISVLASFSVLLDIRNLLKDYNGFAWLMLILSYLFIISLMIYLIGQTICYYLPKNKNDDM